MDFIQQAFVEHHPRAPPLRGVMETTRRKDIDCHCPQGTYNLVGELIVLPAISHPPAPELPKPCLQNGKSDHISLPKRLHSNPPHCLYEKPSPPPMNPTLQTHLISTSPQITWGAFCTLSSSFKDCFPSSFHRELLHSFQNSNIFFGKPQS